jgi:hypothetical protein
MSGDTTATNLEGGGGLTNGVWTVYYERHGIAFGSA